MAAMVVNRFGSSLGSGVVTVAATYARPQRVSEHAIFAEDLVDGRAPTRGVSFTEDVVKIAGQQGRYAVGHGLSPLGMESFVI
jgi:hypothetical protein